MKGKFDRVRKSVRCQSLHKMEVKLSVLPPGMFEAEQYPPATFNNRVARCKIHIGLLSACAVVCYT